MTGFRWDMLRDRRAESELALARRTGHDSEASRARPERTARAAPSPTIQEAPVAENEVQETRVGQGTNGRNGQREAEVAAEWRNAAYNCFSSGHKFCREVCPVMQVTRNESHSPTAFHANVI